MNDILKYKNFLASVHFSMEDNTFYGKVEGVDDSITFEGDAVASLKKAFEEAVIDYIAICKKIGKDVHKSYKGSFNVRIKPELHKQASFKSLEKGVSLNQLVEEAIFKYVKDK